jgi:hypothetical protein
MRFAQGTTRKVLLGSIFACALLAVGSARAAQVMWTFSATVTRVSGSPGVVIGDPVSGSLSYDPDAATFVDDSYTGYVFTEGSCSLSVTTPSSTATVMQGMHVLVAYRTGFPESFAVWDDAYLSYLDLHVPYGAGMITSEDLPVVQADLNPLAAESTTGYIYTADFISRFGFAIDPETFVLQSPIGVSPVSWSAVKALYGER